jgi:hypothetical protein
MSITFEGSDQLFFYMSEVIDLEIGLTFLWKRVITNLYSV